MNINMMTLPSQYHSKSHQVIGRDREALALVLVASASRRGETIVLRGAIEIFSKELWGNRVRHMR